MTNRRYAAVYGSWNDFQCTPYVFPTGASAPDLVTLGPSGSIQAYGFDGVNTTEQMFGTIEIMHDYKQGSPLYPHIHWCPTTTGSGDVIWNLDYSIAAVGQAIQAPATLTAKQAAGGTAWKHNLVEFTPIIAGTGIGIGAILAFRIYRNPSATGDTYGADAVALSVGLHVESDTLGSSTRIAK